MAEIYKAIKTFHFPDEVARGKLPVMRINLSLFSEYYNFTKSKETCIEQKIFYECFKKAFSAWEGWVRLSKKSMCIEKICYELGLYLDKSVKHINTVVYDQIPIISFSKNSSTSFLNVDCTYKKLKQFFYHRPEVTGKSFSLNGAKLYDTVGEDQILPNLVINWPNICIKLNLPGFEITHQNFHVDCFNAISLNNPINLEDYELRIPTHDDLMCRSSPAVTHPTSQVKKFITDLKRYLKSNDELKNSKNEILHLLLTEFQRDLNFCGEFIQSKILYNFNVIESPYVRYLGNTGTDVPQITAEEQLSVEPNTLNVRLQQFVLPMVKFNLLNFHPPLGNFESDPILNNAIKGNCLTYLCTLCNVQYSSILGAYEVCQHLSQEHGLEPDWTCTKCNFSFSNIHLVANRWMHSCTSSNICAQSSTE